MEANARLLKGKPAYYINCAVVVVIMLSFRLLPPFGSITEVGMGCLGIFIGAIYGWLTVGMLWPSLFGLVAYGLTGYVTVDEAMIQGFGSNNVLVLIMVFGLLGIMETSGLAHWLAMKIVTSPIAAGRPWVLAFLLLFASYIIVALTCSWGSAMLIWVIFYSIVDANKIEKGKYTSFVVASIIATAILGGQLFPFAVPVVLLTGAFSGVAGAEAVPGFVPYVIWMFITGVLTMILWLVVAKFIFRVKPPEINLDSLEKPAPLDQYQKITLSVLSLFIIGLVLAGILPDNWTITVALNALGVKGVAALLIAVLIMLNFSQGRSFNDYMKSANWELLVVMALITILSNSLSDETTGILATVTSVLDPVFSGKGMIVFLILITLIPLIITNVLNNLVVGMIFIPISYNFAVQMGFDPTILFIMLVQATSIAPATPSGCAPAAMLYGNTEWITGREALIYGSAFAFLSWLVVLVVGTPLGFLMF